MKKYGRNFGRKNMENKKKKLSAYYKPYKGLFLADMVFAMIGAAITLVIPLMVRYITGTVVLLPIEEASSTIIRLGIFMVLLVIVEGYCNYFIGYYGHVMGAKIEHDMRNEIFGHYQKLSFAFFDNQKVGHLLSRITSDLFDITSWTGRCGHLHDQAGGSIYYPVDDQCKTGVSCDRFCSDHAAVCGRDE